MIDELTRAKELYREFFVLLRPWEKRWFKYYLINSYCAWADQDSVLELYRMFERNHWETCVRATPAEGTTG